jgi:hypothetical protein
MPSPAHRMRTHRRSAIPSARHFTIGSSGAPYRVFPSGISRLFFVQIPRRDSFFLQPLTHSSLLNSITYIVWERKKVKNWPHWQKGFPRCRKECITQRCKAPRILTRLPLHRLPLMISQHPKALKNPSSGRIVTCHFFGRAESACGAVILLFMRRPKKLILVASRKP